MEKNSSNQYIIRIGKALEKRNPSKEKIWNCLYALQAEDSLSNFEFFDIIGEIYQRNSAFFMLSIYPKMRRKFRKVYGNEGIQLMDKYLLEKFCLNKEEQIIYHFEGTIKQKVPKKYTIKVVNGSIYITTKRIVAQGNFIFELYQSTEQIVSGTTKKTSKAKNNYFFRQEPCYGYSFPIKNLYNLTPLLDLKNRKLTYFVLQRTKIIINPYKKKEIEENLHEILNEFQTRE